MPEMVFEYVLKKNGIDPQKDLTIDQSIDFGSTAAAFSGGQGDYTVEFEPSATALEQSGDGTVVASLGVDSGYVPYTAFSAKTSYLEENAETVQAFVRALKKGVDYVKNHSAEDVADAISPQFKETKKETIAAIVSRYADQDTWDETLEFEEEGYDLLLDILDESGTLTARPPYEILVTGEYLPE
jgi:NitT/TauT family transport system substrate-binding protein